MNYMRTASWMAICLFSLVGAGCQMDHSSSYVAWNLPVSTPRLGRTAVAIQSTGGFESPKVTFQNVRDEVAGALAQVPGTTDAALPATLHNRRMNDGDLLAAAGQSGAQTLCVVTVRFVGSYACIGIGIPPYFAASRVDYEVRMFDVKTGTLLIHADQEDQTFHLYEPPTHALVDLRRGMTDILHRSGLLNSAPAVNPTTQPAMIVATGGRGDQRPAERLGAAHADEPHRPAPRGAILARADVRGLLE
ncbi:MAG: hypothetical protein ABSH22_11840 [Tepidisphaeraceae bacterium]|jgi:hypothetical protein